MPCLVCGQRAPYKLCGVWSCHSCAAFFRIYASKPLVPDIFICKNDGVCGSDEEAPTITDCRGCRLKKCFAVGMNLNRQHKKDKEKADLSKLNPTISALLKTKRKTRKLNSIKDFADRRLNILPEDTPQPPSELRVDCSLEYVTPNQTGNGEPLLMTGNPFLDHGHFSPDIMHQNPVMFPSVVENFLLPLPQPSTSKSAFELATIRQVDSRPGTCFSDSFASSISRNSDSAEIKTKTRPSTTNNSEISFNFDFSAPTSKPSNTYETKKPFSVTVVEIQKFSLLSEPRTNGKAKNPGSGFAVTITDLNSAVFPNANLEEAGAEEGRLEMMNYQSPSCSSPNFMKAEQIRSEATVFTTASKKSPISEIVIDFTKMEKKDTKNSVAVGVDCCHGTNIWQNQCLDSNQRQNSSLDSNPGQNSSSEPKPCSSSKIVPDSSSSPEIEPEVQVLYCSKDQSTSNHDSNSTTPIQMLQEPNCKSQENHLLFSYFLDELIANVLIQTGQVDDVDHFFTQEYFETVKNMTEKTAIKNIPETIPDYILEWSKLIFQISMQDSEFPILCQLVVIYIIFIFFNKNPENPLKRLKSELADSFKFEQLHLISRIISTNYIFMIQWITVDETNLTQTQ